MSIQRINQAGIGHIAIMFALVAVVVVGFVGYRVMTVSNNPTGDTNKSASKGETEPSALKTKDDVKKANNDLDTISVDTDLDPSQFDADLSTLQ